MLSPGNNYLHNLFVFSPYKYPRNSDACISYPPNLFIHFFKVNATIVNQDKRILEVV